MHGFPKIFIILWMFENLQEVKGRSVALIKTFARFQAVFLSSDDFHRMLSSDFYSFPCIVIDFMDLVMDV